MGVTLSTQSSLAPISLASNIVGFISFSLTLATFLRVFWENLTTVFKAGRESKNILSTLRIELEEERVSLRELKRHQRRRHGPQAVDVFQGPELDEVDLRSLQDTVRRLTRRFEDIERPFLANEDELDRRKARRRRRSDVRSRRGRSGERDDYEKGGFSGYDSEDERVQDLYSTVSLARRFTWLNTRSEAMQMLEAVNRVQTRRIARQVGEIACMMHSYRSVLDEMRHGVAVTEDRVNRVVGLRRID